jgi:ribonuclease HI
MTDSRWIEKIYTDGACSGNPGPGGWGVVLYFNDGTVQELGGAQANTTNNRMELQAAIAALDAFAQSGQTQAITLNIDSEYVRNGITKWVEGWKKKGWKTAAGKPVLNQDLWEELDALKSNKITWHHVKAHAGDPGNERADTIAASFAQGRSIQLRSGAVATESSPKAVVIVQEAKVQEAKVQEAKVQEAKVQEAKGEYAALMKSVEPEQSHSLLPAVLERLRWADEIASKGYLMTTQELAELVGMSASAVNDRGEEWVWRNWTVARGRKEGNHILWQLERSS